MANKNSILDNNSFLDYGGFLCVLYTFMYVFGNGKVPDWTELYIGAAFMIIIGVIIEIYRKIRKK